MWIMTDVGFVSIVKHNKIPDTMVVRARVKADLQAVFPGHAVETLPGADYLYRATIPTQVVAETLFYKAMGIDYTSHVKDVAIARSAKAEHGNRSHALYDTWSAFADLQELAPYSKVARPAPRFYSAPGKGTPIVSKPLFGPGVLRPPLTPATPFNVQKPFDVHKLLDEVPAYTGQRDWAAPMTDAEMDELTDAELDRLEADAAFDRQYDEVDGMDPVNAVETKRERRNRRARERRQVRKDKDAGGLASAG